MAIEMYNCQLREKITTTTHSSSPGDVLFGQLSTVYASDSELLSSPLMILSKRVENVHCSSTR